MRRRHLTVLVAGLALAGCVGVPVGRQPAPYATYAGDSRFVTPQIYRRGGDNYLYDQSRRSWQPNAYRQDPRYGQTRYGRPDRRDGPPHHGGEWTRQWSWP
jgi:hypothetical protein